LILFIMHHSEYIGYCAS